MEAAVDWTWLEELEDGDAVTEQAAQKVRDNASPGCLICALEEWDDE